MPIHVINIVIKYMYITIYLGRNQVQVPLSDFDLSYRIKQFIMLIHALPISYRHKLLSRVMLCPSMVQDKLISLHII